MSTFAVTKSLDAVSANTTGAAASTDGSTLGGAAVTGVVVHVFGDGATTSSTTIEQSLDKVAWAPALYTVTNVSASGVILVGPPAPYTRAKTVCSSGAVSAYIIPSASVAPLGWKTAQAANTGTLTSVGLVAPAELSIAGSPLTADGDITATWATQTANKVFASAVSGGAATPAFRALVSADIPASVSLTTPVLGVAAATSVNKVAITAPATGATLTILEGKTLTASNSLTLAGTDATTMTFPTTSATVARTDAANTFTGVQTFSSLPVFSAGIRTGAAKLTDGAIAFSNSDIFITKASALGSSTLATPTVGDHDNWTMTFTSTTAFAHVITVETGKVNGAAATTITFTSAAIGDSVTLKAWQGIAYIVDKTGTITLA